jgi:tetratricopeptide (TPR) repeat protein
MRRPPLALVVIVSTLAGACAPKAMPPAAPGALRFPDFVYPAPPDRVGDARTRTQHQAAWSRLQGGDVRGAEAAFAKLATQQPGFFPASAGLGYTLVAAGRSKDAAARFDSVLLQAPSYAPALAGRAEALLAAGDRDGALAGFEAAFAADRSLSDLKRRIDVLRFDRVQARISAARRAADAGRLDEARDAYLAAIVSSPDSAFLYRDLGLVELRRKNLNDAARNLQKAVALDPGDAGAQAGLADVREAQGDLDGAAAALERALELDPTPALRQRLERLREHAQAGGLPAEYNAIPRLAQVTRGDLAALIGIRLRMALTVARSRSSVVATDVRGHWASRWIVEVIRAGVMDVYPNHTFQPLAVVRRSDLAQAVSRVLAISGGRPGRAGRTGPTIADVGADHLSYGDISAAVASGVMSLEGGNFRPSRVVTGQEAVDAVRRLERLAAGQGRGENR